MTSEKRTFNFTQTVNASLEQAYFAFTNATALQQWLCNTADVAANEGGRIYLWWNSGYASSGVFSAVEENKKLAFGWHGFGEPAPTAVEVTFEAQDDGTLVSLAHSGLGEGEAWEKMAEVCEKDWPKSLKNLKAYLELGVDMRQFENPMLGVLIGGLLDDAQAEVLGVPVKTGVVLAGALDGMGAQAAGLQQNDVIVGLDGKEITDFASIGAAIAGRKVGDKVEFVIYRGAEKLAFDVELARRPLPEHPPTAKGLAEQMRKVYEELDAELDAVFEDVTDEEAAKRPAPKEWCANETVAHLIYTERWAQIAISTLVGGQKFPGFANDLGLLAAIANAHPTTADLIAELKRAEATTVGTMANLSDDFVADKGRYFLIAGTFQFTPGHHRLHFRQMEAAIKEARK